MLKEGYIYLLVNYQQDELVKLGSTFKRPEVRVREIQTMSGVSGKYELWHWWRLGNPNYHLVEIFNSLKQYHSSGEYFRLQPYQARSMIDALLENNGVDSVLTMTDEYYTDPDNFRHLLKNYLRLRGRRYNRKIIDEMEANIAKYGHLHGVSLNDINDS